MDIRKALPKHKTPTSDKDWDGPKNEANLKTDQDLNYYKRAYAWRDPDGDESKKSSYKLIHHEVSSDGTPGAANIRACQTAIGVLNGARGGVDIPDEDRQGVWNHLAAHLDDADVEPAPLRSKDSETYQCECIECGYQFESEEHCNEVRCPECGGKCRRVERPGPGQNSKSIIGVGNSMQREVRTYDLDSLEVRTGEDGESKKIRGHAAVFNMLSEDLGGFREIIEPGTFASAIKRDDVRALFNHDPNYILGRNKAGTLTLEEDEKGLGSEIDPPDTQYARDLMVSIERGDISQMSFAFNIDGKKGEWWEVDGEKVKDFMAVVDAMWDGKQHDIIRHVVKAHLYDISPVTYPAYPQTDVKVRSGLAAAGIDYESLSETLAKVRRGEGLSEEEKLTLVKAGETIRGMVPEEAEPGRGGTPGNEGYIRWLGKLRRELELAELE